MKNACCFVIPIHYGAVIIAILGVLSGAGIGLGYSIQIQQGMMQPRDAVKSLTFVPFVGMVSWVALALVSMFGCVVTWIAKPKWVSIYFWLLVGQYIIDTPVLALAFFYCIKGAESIRTECINLALSQNFTGPGVDSLCPSALSATDLLFLGAIAAWKVFLTYSLYVNFRFRTWAVKEAEELKTQEQMLSRPPQDWRGNTTDPNARGNWSKFDD